MVNIVILNDTRRNRLHLGCFEVMETIEYLASKSGMRVIRSYQETDAYRCKDFPEVIDKCDVVLINGEGTFHHDQPESLDLMRCVELAVNMGKSCHLINCTWESNSATCSMLGILDSVFVRDSSSQQAIKDAGFNAVLSPDLSLYKRRGTYLKEGGSQGHRDLTILDSVYWRVTKKAAEAAAFFREDLYVMDISYWIKMKYAPAHLRLALIGKRLRPLNLFSLQGLVVTGRYHGLCLAMRQGQPFMVIPSNTKKSESLIGDVGLSQEKFVLDSSSIVESVRAAGDPYSFLSRNERELINDYVCHAQSSSESMFRFIAGLA